jgi:hypothetical protein
LKEQIPLALGQNSIIPEHLYFIMVLSVETPDQLIISFGLIRYNEANEIMESKYLRFSFSPVLKDHICRIYLT